jgi:hypothetical protein
MNDLGDSQIKRRNRDSQTFSADNMYIILDRLQVGCAKPTEMAPLSPPMDSPVPATKTQSLPSDTLVAPTPSAEVVNIPPTYAHPEVLTNVSWVYSHLDDPSVRIVDAR